MESVELERWRRLQEIFEAAADLDPGKQAAYLASACAGDEAFRRDAEALLRSDAEAGSFIEQAIWRGSDQLLGADPDPLESLGKIGKYEILGRIGEGGFGVVYKGRDPVLQRWVAVKTCSSSDEKLRRRFFREGQIAAGLQHPNITTVHDLGVERGIPYLVQEFLDGEDLNYKIAREEGLTALRRLDILAQVARGLDYAHRQGVLHRDVKPANIRVLPSGDVKIMDFGIAKLLHEVSDVTTQGLTLGTVGYLAPEQLRGEEVDRRTDIFSFGVLVYELFTYERPFRGSTFSEVSFRLLNEEPPALRDLAPACSRAIAGLASRCLAKDPRQRYESFEQVLAVLEPEIEALRSGAFLAAGAASGEAAATTGGRGTAGESRNAEALSAGTAPGGAATSARPAKAPTAAEPNTAVAQAGGAARRQSRWAVAGGLAAAAVALVVAAGLGGWMTARPSPSDAVQALAGRVPGSAPGKPPTVARAPQVTMERSSPEAAGATAQPAGPETSRPSDKSRQTPGGGSGAAGLAADGRGAARPQDRRRSPTDASPARQGMGGRTGRSLAAGGSPAGTAAAGNGGTAEPRGDAEGLARRTESGPRASRSTVGQAPGPAGGGGAAGAGGAQGGEGGEEAWRAAPGAASGRTAGGPDPGDGPGEPGGPSRPMARGDLIPPGAPGATPPRLLSRPEPQYPERARRRQVEGDVLLLALVDENGRVVRTIVKRTDDPGLGFNEAATRAALRTVFDPATRDGLPGKMWTELPFSFRLHAGEP
jgi:TonB family protein